MDSNTWTLVSDLIIEVLRARRDLPAVFEHMGYRVVISEAPAPEAEPNINDPRR